MTSKNIIKELVEKISDDPSKMSYKDLIAGVSWFSMKRMYIFADKCASELSKRTGISPDDIIKDQVILTELILEVKPELVDELGDPYGPNCVDSPFKDRYSS